MVGINYRNTEASIRGNFSIDSEQYTQLLLSEEAQNIDEFFILSTCNRTEIYGVIASITDLARFLCIVTKGDWATFQQYAYYKSGEESLSHLLHVAAGLDSQILGDYEIVGQIKNAYSLANKYSKTGILLNRIYNTTLQLARSVRAKTEISSGSVSVAFAAVQFIKQHFDLNRYDNKKILLIGTGKIGRNTCKNIVRELNTRNINLYNRTHEKALTLAQELDLCCNLDKSFEQQVTEADVILVSTNSKEPTLNVAHLLNATNEKLILDISIPFNVDPEVKNLKGITLVTVDELSKVADATLQKREKEIPKVKQLIQEHIEEFKEWHEMRQYIPLIKATKSTLINLQHEQYLKQNFNITQNDIQRVLNTMALKLREKNEGGCNFITAINDFINH